MKHVKLILIQSFKLKCFNMTFDTLTNKIILIKKDLNTR